MGGQEKQGNGSMSPNPSGSPRNLGELLSNAALRWPLSEVVFPTERKTFGELDYRATRMARLIRAAGAEPRSHVGVLLGPSVDMVAALFGIARAGCVIVPISDRSKAVELRHIIRHSDLRVLITTDMDAHVDFPAIVSSAIPSIGCGGKGPAPQEAPELRRIVLLGESETDRPGFTRAQDLQMAASISMEDLAEVAAVQNSISSEDLAYILYTSGTSAAAKGCMIPHANVLRHARALANTRFLLGSTDTFWCPLPLFHNGGLSTLMQCVSSGASFVHAGHFDADVALRQLEQERCTHAFPTFEAIWLPILNHPRFAEADLSALRVTFSAGSEARFRYFQARLPRPIQLSNYGLTETTGHFSMTLLRDPLEVRATTGGHPLPGNEVRVVDPKTSLRCAPGVMGEILVRGDMVFRGYYKAAESTAELMEPGGWFHTGDLGRLDSEGRLTFLDRLKDMLKVGGENVAAAEVEAFLLEHPAIQVAAVVAAPDAIYEEVPAAFIQLKQGAHPTEAEIINYCLGQISTFKVPRYVRFVTEWPMSSTKIRKVALREKIAAELKERGITSAPRLRSSDSTGRSPKPDKTAETR